MKLKAIYIAAFALTMISTQACASEGYRDEYGGHHGMHGSYQGMDMHGGDFDGGMHHGGHGYSGHGRGSNLMDMAKFKGIRRLNLNDEQRKKFRAIKHQLKKDLWQLMGKMIDAKDNLRDLWDADKPDPAKVGAAYKDMFDLQRQAIELRVGARNKIYDMLSPEQREQFRSHHGSHGKGGHHGDMGSGHGHGPM